VINYADDFVILSRGCAAEAKAWAAEVMSRLGLKLNETKTCLRDACKERFDFLGYSFGPRGPASGALPVIGGVLSVSEERGRQVSTCYSGLTGLRTGGADEH
jgi:hypothetical protein